MYKLTLQNRAALWNYLCHEPEMNLFFLGDLENFGFESENVEFYAMDRSDEKDFDCVLLRFHDHFQLYSIYEDYNLSPNSSQFFQSQIKSIPVTMYFLKMLFIFLQHA